MLGLSLTSIWLTIGLMVSQITWVHGAIDSYFDLPSGAGECSGTNTMSFLNDMMSDASSLIDGMQNAVSAAVNSGSTAKEKKNRIVARKLFTSFFGFTFLDEDDVVANDGEYVVVDDDLDAWDVLTAAIDNVEEFIADETYITTKIPPILFCDNFANKFPWNTQAKDALGNAIVESDGYEPTIRDLYTEFEEAGATPYWIPALKRYMFTDYDSADLCSEFYGATIYGYQSSTAFDDAGDSIRFQALPDTVLICPKVLWGGTEDVDLLDDIEYVAPYTAERLSDILPRSSTLFHEMFHMTTHWVGDDVGDDVQVGSNSIVDITYDLFKALKLATGTLTNTEASGIDSDSDTDSDSGDDSDSIEYSGF
ncbi:hypothetical protein N7490_003087 [Penicillium lividum]|nr:hypothetical protein N7490_003087 [Penicillium lividum]